jgi:rubrerythrin
MLSDREFEYVSCEGKYKFTSKRHARRAMGRMNESGLHAYYCKFCGFHHIGHKTKGSR